MKKAKGQYYMHRFLETARNTRLMRQTVKEIVSKSPKAKKVLFQLDGLTELEISDLFNEHFINVGAPTKDIAEVPCKQFITKCRPIQTNTDQSEILEIILSLKDSCAAGADCIKPKPLKAVKYSSRVYMQPNSFSRCVPGENETILCQLYIKEAQ